MVKTTKCTKKQLAALAKGREKRAKNIRLNNRLKNQLGGGVNSIQVRENLDRVDNWKKRMAIYATATAICKGNDPRTVINASSGKDESGRPLSVAINAVPPYAHTPQPGNSKLDEIAATYRMLVMAYEYKTADLSSALIGCQSWRHLVGAVSPQYSLQ